MKKRLMILGLSMGLMVTMLPGVASAKEKTPTVKKNSPSLVITSVCSGFNISFSWSNQPIGPGGLAAFGIFSGQGLPDTASNVDQVIDIIRTDGSWEVGVYPYPDQGIPLDEWTSVTLSTFGAFSDTSKPFDQPAGGWPPCSP